MLGQGPMTVDDQAKFLKQQSGLIKSMPSNERDKKLEEKRIREEKL